MNFPRPSAFCIGAFTFIVILDPFFNILGTSIIISTVVITFKDICEITHSSPLCGERGIRTPGTLLGYTRFPGVPVKPLLHLSMDYSGFPENLRAANYKKNV
jgi:hypothetical protein